MVFDAAVKAYEEKAKEFGKRISETTGDEWSGLLRECMLTQESAAIDLWWLLSKDPFKPEQLERMDAVIKGLQACKIAAVAGFKNENS